MKVFFNGKTTRRVLANRGLPWIKAGGPTIVEQPYWPNHPTPIRVVEALATLGRAHRHRGDCWSSP